MPTHEVPRAEHPRPQFRRADWQTLNGEWTCRIDPPGEPSDAHECGPLERPILVPFAPESRLSGIGHTDFIESLWYHRYLRLPDGWAGRRVLLHFGAVDWHARVFIDGVLVAEHWGGATGFQIDVSDRLEPGREHDLVVHALDDTRGHEQPCGKQSRERNSYGCYYTRTTGIWQSVWLEATGPSYLRSLQILPDLDGGRLLLTPTIGTPLCGLELEVSVSLAGAPAGSGRRSASSGQPVSVDLETGQPWSPEEPTLYDLALVLRDAQGQVVDEVHSYAGLRSVSLDGDRILLNGQPRFLRLVLDQGFYPDGVWTAPDDATLRRDIELAMAMGFNGARLHQKVFEPRFHFWADRLGYLTWGESPSWGFDVDRAAGARNFLAEWPAIIEQCRNHPSLIVWSPLNESGHRAGRGDTPISDMHRRLVRDAAALTRQMDTSRPVNDASGWAHQDTDIWTAHNYEQDPAVLRRTLEPHPDVFRNAPASEPDYAGQPYVLAEFGGAAWQLADAGKFEVRDTKTKRLDNTFQSAWGYGEPPKNAAEFEARLRAQVQVACTLNHIRGFCYTQLTDIEQEQNGLLTFEREAKLPLETYRQIFADTPEPARGATGGAA